MLDLFITQFQEKYNLQKTDRIAVACSGGVDSMLLCHLLLKMEIAFSILHCNFNLRGKESLGDASFVKDFALRNRLDFYQIDFDTNSYAEEKKISIQMAARELRYEWFHQIRSKENFRWIATAHHLDDDIETLLINIGRGTGIRGILGIPDKTNGFIRPLLNFSKSDIITYAKDQSLEWREDKSNQSTEYLRNHLRLKVIPEWKRKAPYLSQGFLRVKTQMQQSLELQNDYLSLVKKQVWRESELGIEINLERLSEFPNTSNLLYELLFSYGFTAWQDIEDLQNAQSGKFIYSQTHRLLKDRTSFWLSEKKKNQPVGSVFITKSEDLTSLSLILEKISAKVFKLESKRVIFVSEKKIRFPLELRLWKAGDFFYPIGMIGKKKLSKYFKDEKYSLLEKEAIWVLCSEDDIVWVVGHRADKRFLLDSPEEAKIKITI